MRNLGKTALPTENGAVRPNPMHKAGYDGLGGVDILFFAEELGFGGSMGVTVDLPTGTATDSFGNAETLANIEGAVGTIFGDSLVGDTGDNVFAGLDGDDTIQGGAGVDLIDHDIGLGFDAIGGIFVDLPNNQILDDRGGTDFVSGVEQVIGTGFDDVFIGDGADNLFAGFDGNDSFEGGLGFDIVDYSREEGEIGVVVNLVASSGLDGFGFSDTLSGIEGVYGTDLSDDILGDGEANEIAGGLGDDTLDGGFGDDTLRYDLDPDVGFLTVDLTNGVATRILDVGIIPETDQISRFEAVVGSERGDVFVGSEAGETLTGLGDGDSIDPLGGADLVRPGLGGDTINLFELSGASDTVEGTAAELDGDTLAGFTGQDFFRVLDDAGAPVQAAFTLAGTDLEIDADGDGIADAVMVVADGFTGPFRNADFQGNSDPTADPIGPLTALETDGPVAIDLIADANATDVDGDPLSAANVAVTSPGRTVQFGVAGSVLTIAPFQFADEIAAGESVLVDIAYDVVDGFGGVTPNTATLEVNGVDGPFTFFRDADADAFGVDNPLTNVVGFNAPAGFAGQAGDADDADATIFPGAPEINDFKDNDQDGEIDEDNQAPVAAAFALGVVTERNAPVTTSLIQSRVTDPDGDLLSLDDVEVVEVATGDPVAFTLGGFRGESVTIDPAQFAERLAGGETLDIEIRYGVSDGFGGATTNLGTLTVAGVDGPFTVFRDVDGDGFGVDSPDTNQRAYEPPFGFSDTAGDADDADPAVFPGALEFNDGKDNDQNGEIDETNRAPTAQDDAFTALVDQPLSISGAALLALASDPDGDALTASLVDGGARNGTVVADGASFVFTPDPGFTGTAGFDYVVSDGFGGTDTASVDVTVRNLRPQTAAANQRVLTGSEDEDLLVAGPGRSLRILGGAGGDVFVFGLNSGDGVRDGAVILDFEQGVDKIDIGGLPFVQLGWRDRKVVLGGRDEDTLTVEGVDNLTPDDFVDLFGVA